MEDKKKGICRLQLNNISSVEDDPTLMKCTFSIIDFDVSWNNQIISEELAIEASPSLRLKPLLCQYFPTTNYENQNDHFGSHGEEESVDRYGEEVIITDSIAIGTSTEKGGYVETIKDENNQDKRVLLCDFVLWKSRFPDICDLIQEIWDSGLPLYSSCEYWFSNYAMNNGIMTIESPLWFDGHCILQSNENGTGKVDPAYDSSKLISLNEKLNKAIAQAINLDSKQNNSKLNDIKSQLNKNNKTDIDIKNINKDNVPIKEENNMASTKKMFKKVCELSYGDTVSKLYTELSKVITGEEYNNCWISDYNVFDTYFIYETYTEADGWNYYKVNYTKDNENDTVTIDIASRMKTDMSVVWTSTEVVEETQASLNTANETIKALNTKVTGLMTEKENLTKEKNSLVKEKETLTTSLNEKENLIKTANSNLETVTKEKDTVTTKFNNASVKLTSLNELVNKLVPVKEAYDKEQYNKALNEKTEYYSKKFKAVNAVDKFNSKEVKDLIKKAINDSDEGKEAVLQLNTMLVDMVQLDEKAEDNKITPAIKEVASKQKDLIPSNNTFESKYGWN